MPKYIRTKDNLFKVVGEDWLGNEDEDIENMELDGYWVEPHSQNEKYRKYNRNFIESEKALNSADTIEELCDVAILNHTICVDMEYSGADFHKAKVLSKLFPKAKCYGAIWTDKGLIYVAKMNEKGELELL